MLSNKRSDTLVSLLQDLRKVLGVDYTFYQECVIAIARAAAYHEDASAWREQIREVVERVEEAQISHAGVMFLLEEMERSEVAPKKEMPPPPVSRHNTQPPTMDQLRSPALRWSFSNLVAVTPSPLASTFETTPTQSPSMSALKVPEPKPAPGEEAASLLKNPHHDPIFFSDLLLGHEINDFFGITAGGEINANCGTDGQHTFNCDASYNHTGDFIVRYDPAADDVETFRDDERREERDAVEEEKRQMARKEQALLRATAEETDILSQPLLLQRRNYATGRRGGKKR